LNRGGGYRFIDGNLMFGGASGSRSIGVWYQTSGQTANAIRLYATLANQVRTVHQKRGDMKAADDFSNGADAVMGALATLPSTNSYSPTSNNFNQYALRVQEQERQKEQHRRQIVAEYNANELEQRRRYEAEKQADLAVRAQTEKDRLAEERRAMEDLRSRSQNGEAKCRPREIACSTPASCNSAYMSLPICNY
jgi:Zn-dependent M16 (insulinase) family peptidase